MWLCFNVMSLACHDGDDVSICHSRVGSGLRLSVLDLLMRWWVVQASEFLPPILLLSHCMCISSASDLVFVRLTGRGWRGKESDGRI